MSHVPHGWVMSFELVTYRAPLNPNSCRLTWLSWPLARYALCVESCLSFMSHVFRACHAQSALKFKFVSPMNESMNESCLSSLSRTENALKFKFGPCAPWTCHVSLRCVMFLGLSWPLARYASCFESCPSFTSHVSHKWVSHKWVMSLIDESCLL